LLPARVNHAKIAHRQVLDAWPYSYYQGCTWPAPGLHRPAPACTWPGLPSEFGDWHAIYMRLNCWAKADVLERMARAVQQECLHSLTSRYCPPKSSSSFA